MSCLVLSDLILSRLILSYLVLFCLVFSDMSYGKAMSLGTNVGDSKTPVPLWDSMTVEEWKKQTYYTLQRYNFAYFTVL